MASGIKLSQEEFLKRASEANPDYDFSEAVYMNNKTQVKVICKLHGPFYVQAASCFKNTLTCPECDRLKRKEAFIEKATKTHNGKYDYSQVEYIDGDTKVKVICPIHGEFFTTPNEHGRRSGCPKCSKQYKPTTEEWIDSVKDLYGGKYDLSEVVYVTNKTPIKVICPEHGAFYPLPNNYKAGKSGCPKCNNERKRKQFSKTTEGFIKDAVLKHGDKYDYSKVKYINKTNLIEIICPTHGSFWQSPSVHTSGSNCPLCARESRKNKIRLPQTEFISRLKSLYENKYDYSKIEYVDYETPVVLICPEHGEFKKTPSGLLKGHACPICGSKAKTSSEFIDDAIQVHGQKYDYSKVQYTNCSEKVCIVCPEHGEFWQTPNSHLQGVGCPKCGGGYKYTTEEFIKLAKSVHGDTYDDSKVEYVNNHTPVCIICRTHGEFWQTPQAHLSLSSTTKRRGCGCPKCRNKEQYKLFERLQADLPELELQFEYSPKWLGLQRFDMYSVKYNIAIEYDGEQHFRPIEGLGGDTAFKLNLERDQRKNRIAEENNCTLYRFKYDYTEAFYNDIIQKVNEIIKH